MNSYGPLARWYDSLTRDVPYDSFADFYEAEFASDGGEFRLLLDLCCGTGTLTCLMAERGYDMIAADESPDMLMQARENAGGLAAPPLFLCQSASELDLYGTVDAAICSLDGMDFAQYVLVGSTVRSYLSWLKDTGRLTVEFGDGELLWKAI